MSRVWYLWLFVGLVSGCLPSTPELTNTEPLGCETNADCLAGSSCINGACVDPSKCGDGIVQIGEVCDDGDANSDDWSLEPHCNASCSGNAPHCGDGTTDNADGEVCDAGDANTASYTATPGCNTTCSGPNPHCGDGETQESELCDDGDANTDAYSASEVCNSTCNDLAPRCGDGVLQESDGETCDSGAANTNAYSGAEIVCNSTCSGEAPRCGDGTKDEGFEVCDQGDSNTYDYRVDKTCVPTCDGYGPHCGDGDVQSSQGEVCDSGDDNSNSYSIEPGCNLTCSGSNPHCGDNVINGNEVCDDGEANSDSYSFAEHCNGSCTANYSGGYCGDGNINAPFEKCDDGNDATRDSCPSGPNGPCQPATCGDGLIWDTVGGQEQCEPGVTEALSCQEVDGAELEGFASCSDVLCRYNSSECFDGPLDFVRIDAGTFTMGSPESELGRDFDETQHEVTLTNDFYLSDHEVTQAEWQALIGNNPSQENNGTCPTCPVEQVNWWEALYYANSLSSLEELTPCYVFEGCSGVAGESLSCAGVTLQDGNGATVTTPYECEGYRLPTEAEWEYAARAGTTTAFYNGDITVPEGSDPNADAIAWYTQNSGNTTHAVKGKLPNTWGLYDMSGNVFEWTWDRYDYGYPAYAVTDPKGPSSGDFRVSRGGGWDSYAVNVRVAYRKSRPPGIRLSILGFRLARTVGVGLNGDTSEPENTTTACSDGVDNDGDGFTDCNDPECSSLSVCGEGETVLFISEYSEGSSNNKYIEIYNPTAAAVSLSNYRFSRCSNGCDAEGVFDFPNDVFNPGATIAAGDVYVLCHPLASATIQAQCDETYVYLFNGDDTFALVEAGGAVVDMIGTMDTTRVEEGWSVAGVANATKDHTLVRKTTIERGETDWSVSAGTDATDSQWIVLEKDEWTYLGIHPHSDL